MRGLAQRLGTVRPGDPWLSPFLSDLRELLAADNAIAYRPVPREAGWDLDLVEWVGESATERKAAHLGFVRSCAPDVPSFAAYDPYAVQPEQRNRALTVLNLSNIERTAPIRHLQVHTALGTLGVDQLRVLVCEGPRLLAWVGVTRPEPFRPEECEALQSLTEPLTQRLLVDRGLRPRGVHEAALEAVLDAFAGPAIVLHESGAVEVANQAGVAWLAHARASDEFRTLVSALPGGGPSLGFTLLRLGSRGCPGYVLALSTARASSIAADVARASDAWALSPRQRRVLEEVASGRSNKDIAALMACAEVTVEKHLTNVFRMAGARSRAELLARMRQIGEPGT